MKLYLRNIVFACFVSLCLSIQVHATYENKQHSDTYNSQQPVVVMRQADLIPEHPYTDEYWLFGSVLAGLTGLIILVRFLHRQ